MEPMSVTDHADADAPSETGTRDDTTGSGGRGGTDGGAAAAGGLSWGRAMALAAAMCWLGGAIGWTIAQRSDAVDLGSVDTGFYLDMIAHHEQAVEMSLVELGQGEDPTVLAFAPGESEFRQTAERLGLDVEIDPNTPGG